MSWRGIFAAAFAGKILATLVIAIGVALGFGPTLWAEWLIRDMPEFITPGIARWGLGGLAILALALIWGPSIYRAVASAHSLSNPDMTAHEAVAWIAHESRWGWRKLLKLNFREMVGLFAIREFDDGARAGRIAVRGRPAHSAEYETLDRYYWYTAGLEAVDVLNPNGSSGRTERKTFEATQLFFALLTSRAEVHKAWPKATIIERLGISGLLKLKVLWYHIGPRHRRDGNSVSG